MKHNNVKKNKYICITERDKIKRKIKNKVKILYSVKIWPIKILIFCTRKEKQEINAWQDTDDTQSVN